MIRVLRNIIACVCASLLVFAPTASADMRGVDVSNWQCNIDTGALDADFIVAGATWGVGGLTNIHHYTSQTKKSRRIRRHVMT